MDSSLQPASCAIKIFLSANPLLSLCLSAQLKACLSHVTSVIQSGLFPANLTHYSFIALSVLDSHFSLNKIAKEVEQITGTGRPITY